MQPFVPPRRQEGVQAAISVGVEADQPTLDALFRAHVPRALRLAILLTGSRALAEDIVQEAFIRVATRRRALRDPHAFAPYLERAVVNQVNSHFRHQRVVRKHAAATQPSDVAVVDPDVATRDLLWAALQRLSERRRSALVLRYYDDMAEREIAAVMGCRPGTVKSLISRGLAQLREELGDV